MRDVLLQYGGIALGALVPLVIVFLVALVRRSGKIKSEAVLGALDEVARHAQIAVLDIFENTIKKARASADDGSPVGAISAATARAAKVNAIGYVETVTSAAAKAALGPALGQIVDRTIEASAARLKLAQAAPAAVPPLPPGASPQP